MNPRIKNIVKFPRRIFTGYLAEEYDGIGQYVKVTLARSSTSVAMKARIAAGDFAGGRRFPAGTRVPVVSIRGHLEVLLGNLPQPVVISGCLETFSRVVADGWGNSEWPHGNPWVIGGGDQVSVDGSIAHYDGIQSFEASIDQPTHDTFEFLTRVKINSNIGGAFEGGNWVEFYHEHNNINKWTDVGLYPQFTVDSWRLRMWLDSDTGGAGSDIDIGAFQDGAWINLRYRGEPNNLMAKAWYDGQAEPDWQATVNWTAGLTQKMWVFADNDFEEQSIEIDSIDIVTGCVSGLTWSLPIELEFRAMFTSPPGYEDVGINVEIGLHSGEWPQYGDKSYAYWFYQNFSAALPEMHHWSVGQGENDLNWTYQLTDNEPLAFTDHNGLYFRGKLLIEANQVSSKAWLEGDEEPAYVVGSINPYGAAGEFNGTERGYFLYIFQSITGDASVGTFTHLIDWIRINQGLGDSPVVIDDFNRIVAAGGFGASSSGVGVWVARDSSANNRNLSDVDGNHGRFMRDSPSDNTTSTNTLDVRNNSVLV